ncbi:MAG: hypothetical protein HN521_04730 [Candidatus Latescibacteria bacterium]|nr:hypothetical protein [Candidatus Latescibacterota bacterium]MBT5830284.1 hypothetical protein [Candidatus Latescibacterota bacterium]
MPKGSVDFANAWGNALGMKMRLATRGNATDNLGLTFCYCRYPAADGGGRYDTTMMSVGLSQKSTFNDDAKLRPYVKGEAGVMQGLDVWETTHDPVTGSALHTQIQGGHTDSYLSGHMGLVLDMTAQYQLFAETGFILTLQGERKKVVPFQVGFAFHP